MATTYPSSKQTFTDPAGTQNLDSPDHAGLHTDINDTVEALEDTVGTTLGTNVLINFSAGQFPVRNTGGGATGTIVQTLVGGTIQNSFIGTTQITGGTLSSQTVGTPNITGGTHSSAIIGATGGTLNNITIGTPAITGGTVNNAILGTPTITGGTFNNQTFGSPNIQSGTISGTVVGTIVGSYLDSCFAYTSTTQNLANNTLGSITLGTEQWDTNAFHDNSTNPTRITIKKPGKYQISGVIRWASNGTGVRHIYIGTNGVGTQAAAADYGETINATSGIDTRQNMAVALDLGSADYVQIFGQQTSGTTLDLNAWLVVHQLS